MLRDEHYYQISGWMITKLHLKGNELHAFALLYGFCQEGSKYTGSLRYLSDWLGCSRQTSITILKKLCDQKLLIKHSKTVNKVTFNEYELNRETLDLALGTPAPKPKQDKEKAPSAPIAESAETSISPNISSNISKKRDIFKDYASDDMELLQLLKDFDQVRRSSRSPMTDRARQILIKKLEIDFPTREEKIATLEQSIERGYRSVFPVKIPLVPAKQSAGQYSYDWGEEGKDFI